MAKTVPGQGTTLFVYDSQSQLIGEYDPAGRPIEETVYLGRTPIAVLANGSVYRIHADHLNAPRVIQDPAGKIVWTWDSDPYGNAWDQTGPTAAHGQLAYNLRLPGQYYDKETGLHYNGFRDYDPGTGRYVEADPIGLLGGLNTYSYVGGNPLTWVDPLGLASLMPGENPLLNGPSGGGSGLGGGGSLGGTPLRCPPVSTTSSPNFAVTPGGTAFPVPKGASGPVPVINPAGKQTGVALTGGKGGANGQVDTVRLMDPTPPRGSSPGYPNGYIKYENSNGQGVDPYSGRTVPNSQSHYPID